MDGVFVAVMVGVLALGAGWTAGYFVTPFRYACKPGKEVERPVFGEPVAVTLYSVWVPDTEGGYTESFSGKRHYFDGETRYYATCEQAHAEHPGSNVTAIQAIRVDGDLMVGKLTVVKVQPKQKVAKGKR